MMLVEESDHCAGAGDCGVHALLDWVEMKRSLMVVNKQDTSYFYMFYFITFPLYNLLRASRWCTHNIPVLVALAWNHDAPVMADYIASVWKYICVCLFFYKTNILIGATRCLRCRLNFKKKMISNVAQEYPSQWAGHTCRVTDEIWILLINSMCDRRSGNPLWKTLTERECQHLVYSNISSS